MPPTAQRLREPAAFVLLAFGAISTFFFTISFLFGPGDSGASTFSSRAPGALAALSTRWSRRPWSGPCTWRTTART